MDKTWIRRDRADGLEEEVSEAYATQRLVGYYNPLGEAMQVATANMPLTTGSADYWPKGGQRV